MTLRLRDGRYSLAFLFWLVGGIAAVIAISAAMVGAMRQKEEISTVKVDRCYQEFSRIEGISEVEVEADCHEGTCYPTIVSFSIDRLPGSLVRINAAHGALTFLDSSQVLERIQIVQIGVWKVEGYGALENRDPSGGLRPIPFGVSGIETGAKGRYRASFPCNVNCIQDVIDNYEVLESFLRSCPKRERPGSLESEDDNWRERIKYWVVEEKAEIIPDSK